MSSRRQFHRCLRCGYVWLGRHAFRGDECRPRRCACCRSPRWDTLPSRLILAEARRRRSARL